MHQARGAVLSSARLVGVHICPGALGPFGCCRPTVFTHSRRKIPPHFILLPCLRDPPPSALLWELWSRAQPRVRLGLEHHPRGLPGWLVCGF